VCFTWCFCTAARCSTCREARNGCGFGVLPTPCYNKTVKNEPAKREQKYWNELPCVQLPGLSKTPLAPQTTKKSGEEHITDHSTPRGGPLGAFIFGRFFASAAIIHGVPRRFFSPLNGGRFIATAVGAWGHSNGHNLESSGRFSVFFRAAWVMEWSTGSQGLNTARTGHMANKLLHLEHR
jgi:hypothetical protein